MLTFRIVKLEMNNVYLSCCILPKETQETKTLSFIKKKKAWIQVSNKLDYKISNDKNMDGTLRHYGIQGRLE